MLQGVPLLRRTTRPLAVVCRVDMDQTIDPLRYGNRQQMGFSTTFSRQHEVPKLPLPTLEDTVAKYLVTIEPFAASTAELEATRKAAAEFLSDPDVRERQKQLEKLRAEKDNWVEDLWLGVGYHQWTAPLAINSNVVGYLYGKYRLKASQAWMSAAVTLGALDYRRRLLKGQIPINMARDKPQSMDQYSRMFDLTRIPGEKQDSFMQNKEPAKHIIAIAGMRLYKVVIEDDAGEPPSLSTLQSVLHSVLTDAKEKGNSPFPVAAFTTGERTKWAKYRKQLQKLNPQALADVETAAFVVCMDDGIDVADRDVAASSLVGDGRSRWMDKSFNLVIRADGNPAIHVEHSWADAPVPLDMALNHAIPYAERAERCELSPTFGSWPAPKEIEFTLDAELKRALRATEQSTDAAIADSDMEVVQCLGLGKPVWKQAGLSPDAAVQMAMQLAYRRMHGGNLPVATYETIGMVNWLNGRTECCRVVSTSGEKFVQSMLSGFLRTRSEPSRAEAEQLLRAACDAHLRYIAEGQQGKGVDRHMFGLRMMSKDGTQPALFMDPLFARSGSTGGFVLSTSNNSYIPRNFGGMFGAGMPNGYGVCYIPYTDSVVLCIESKRSCAETSSLRFGQMVNECLMDIATVAGIALPKSML